MKAQSYVKAIAASAAIVASSVAAFADVNWVESFESSSNLSQDLGFWGINNIIHQTNATYPSNSFIKTTTPGGTVTSDIVSKNVIMNRSSGLVIAKWSLQFPTVTKDYWKDNNKVYVSLCDASGNPLYQLYFRPNRAYDQYRTYDIELLKKSGSSFTSLKQVFTKTIAPSGASAAFVNFEMILSPNGKIAVYYDAGTGLMTKYIDITDNTYSTFSYIRLKYQTGTGRDAFFINADNFQVNTAPATTVAEFGAFYEGSFPYAIVPSSGVYDGSSLRIDIDVYNAANIGSIEIYNGVTLIETYTNISNGTIQILRDYAYNLGNCNACMNNLTMKVKSTSGQVIATDNLDVYVYFE